MTITVYGTPAPKGSKRFVGVAKTGRGILVESSAKVRPWAEAVKCEVRTMSAWEKMDTEGPVSVHVVFTLRKPQSAPKRIRTWPDRKPDIDKLCRSTIDALTDAGVWEDDARVVRLVATKCYPGEGTDALHIPGCVIHISEVKE